MNWRNTSDSGSKFFTFERVNLTLEEINKNWDVPFNWRVSFNPPVVEGNMVQEDAWSHGFYLGLGAPNTVDQAKYTVEVGLSLVNLGTWIADCVRNNKGSRRHNAMKAVVGVQAHRNVEVSPINERQRLIALNSDYAFQDPNKKEMNR
jgi:hypothetical protein